MIKEDPLEKMKELFYMHHEKDDDLEGDKVDS